MPYLLDTNVFIQAKNLHYAFDFCPAFWDWILAQHAARNVFSIQKVGDEVAAIQDELSSWASALGPAFFLPPTATTMTSLVAVSTWSTSQGYEPAAVSTFFQVADYYLTAEGLARGYTVVTHEIPSTSLKKIKIPNACVGVGVKTMSPYEMLRVERARFVLGPMAPQPGQLPLPS